MITFPVIISLFVTILSLVNINSIIPTNLNPWVFILGRYILNIYSLLYPIIIAIFVHSVFDIERKNNNFKLLLTMPISRINIFVVKIIYLILVLYISIFTSYLFFYISGYTLHFIEADFCFTKFNSNYIIILYFSKLLASLTIIILIQFLLSLIFKSFVFPVSFCSFITLLSIMFHKNEWVEIIPYNFPHMCLCDFISGSRNISIFNLVNLMYIMIVVITCNMLIKRISV